MKQLILELTSTMATQMTSKNAFISVALFLLLIFPSLSQAANRDVCPRCSYHTVGDAFNAAQNGDVVRVAAGTYAETAIFNGTKSLRVEGGYSPDFSTRAPSEYPTILSSVGVSYYHSGDAAIDGVTITGSSTQGIFAWAPNSNLSVTNCRIHHNASSGILVTLIKSVTIVGNTLWSNGGYGEIYVSDNAHSLAVITDNSTSGSTCPSCSGIYFSNVLTTDVFTRNVSFDNTTGISVHAASQSEAPLIEWNVAHRNSGTGFSISGGAPTVRHNLSYDNGYKGLFYSSIYGGSFLHNVFARNAGEGLHLAGASGGAQPVIRNNIFFANDIGVSLSGLSGWGSTTLAPVLEYNDFFANVRSELVHSGEYPWGFESEEPGTYGELNGPQWSNNNVYLDPGFVDSAHGNFFLTANSFLIDEGSPSDPYSSEPAPNGQRPNIGLYGNTSTDQISPSAPALSNVVALANGKDVIVQFDASQATSQYWLTLEKNVGTNFEQIPDSAVAGDSIERGYKSNRVRAGALRTLRWIDGAAHLDPNDAEHRLRLTIAHGNQSASATAALPEPCDVSISTERTTFSAAGGIPTLQITSACRWAASSDVPWVTPERFVGVGNAQSWFNVALNTGTEARTGHLFVGNKTIPIVQAGSLCPECLFPQDGGSQPLRPIASPTPTRTRTAIPTMTPRPAPTVVPPTPLSTPKSIVPTPTPSPRNTAPFVPTFTPTPTSNATPVIVPKPTTSATPTPTATQRPIKTPTIVATSIPSKGIGRTARPTATPTRKRKPSRKRPRKK